MSSSLRPSIPRAPLAIAIALLAVVLGTTALLIIHPMANDSAVPNRRECLALVKGDVPILKSEAARLFGPKDRESISVADDCEYGGYPSLQGVVASVAAVDSEMRDRGAVRQVKNSECLKYLKPSECDAFWVYRPTASRHVFRVEMDPHTASGGSEFAMSVEHSSR